MILPFALVIERACKGVWLLAGQFASVNTRPGFQHSDVDELKSASPTADDAVPATSTGICCFLFWCRVILEDRLSVQIVTIEADVRFAESTELTMAEKA